MSSLSAGVFQDNPFSVLHALNDKRRHVNYIFICSVTNPSDALASNHKFMLSAVIPGTFCFLNFMFIGVWMDVLSCSIFLREKNAQIMTFKN